MATATDQQVSGTIHVGRIVQVIGSTFDAEFEESHLPEIYNALEVDLDGKLLVLEVAQHLSESSIRAIALGSTDGLQRGAKVSNTGAAISVPIGEKTLGSLVELFEEKSFAILFVILLGVPALPLPTGGATHVFELIAILLGLQLIAGRDQIWLPQRWRKLVLAGGRQERFIVALLKMIRWLERFSRPRLRVL